MITIKNIGYTNKVKFISRIGCPNKLAPNKSVKRGMVILLTSEYENNE